MYKKQKNFSKGKLIYLISMIILIICDQIAKDFFINEFEKSNISNLYVTSFLNFDYVWNSGISFGFFANLEQSNYLFVIISSLITLYFFKLFWQESNKFIKTSYSLIIGGAIGNIIDRIRYEAVFDFIDFHIGNYHWPSFNLADSYITTGGFLLIFYLFTSKLKGKNELEKL